MQAADRAKATLKDLQDSAKREGDVEAEAALKAAAAHEADTRAINESRQALERQAAAAKAANVQVAWGGRDSMQSHLSDLDSERQRRDLLNKAEWMGYSSPQQAESFRQQVYQQQLLRNRAGWQGYSSPDQYLNYLDSERQRITAQSEAIKVRSQSIRAETDDLTGHADALQQAHQSTQTLGTEGTRNVQGYQSQLDKLPDNVSTHVSFDSDNAMGDWAQWQAALHTVPTHITTVARLDTTELAADLAKARAELATLGSIRIPAEVATPSAGTSTLGSAAAATAPVMGGLRQDARGGWHDATGRYVSTAQASAMQAAQQQLAQQAAEQAEREARASGYMAGPSSLTAAGVAARNRSMGIAAQPEAAALGNQIAALRNSPFTQMGSATATSPSQLTDAALASRNRSLMAFLQPEAAQFGATASGVFGGALSTAQRIAAPGAQAAAGGSPAVALKGAMDVQAALASIRNQMKALSSEIANPKVNISSAEALAALQAIRKAILQVGEQTKGLGIEPEGLDKVRSQFTALQAQAGRAFDDLTSKSTSSATTVMGRWREVGGNISDIFKSMVASSEAAGEDIGGVFDTLASRIGAAFKGVTGSGLVTMFGSLARAAAASGAAVVSGIGPMILTFTTIIQLLPPLVAGMGALGTTLAVMPESVSAVATVMVTLKEAISPVLAALQAYQQVLQAGQAMSANPIQTAMENAAQQNQLANAYYNVQQAAYQSFITQQQNAHSVSDAQFQLTQAVVQSANQQVVAAHAVKDAQFADQQASYQARMSEIEDAHAVADARYSASQAYFQQSIQQVQSAMSIAEAQHGLQDAVFSTAQAQYQLNIAWQTASEDLAQLELQVGAASLNMRGAQLALEQAQQGYAQTMADSTATALDRANAAYQIQQAEENLKQVELQNKDNETQLADVRKYGANQVFGVVQAQHELTDAQFSQVQAQKQLILTQREAANAQIQAAHEIKDAVFSLWQAERQQGNDYVVNLHDQADASFNLQQAVFEQRQAQITGAHSVTDAQFALLQAQEAFGEGFVTSAHDQKQAAFELQQSIDQMALGLPGIASSEEQLATAMYRLGPAAKVAVTDLEPLAKWFDTNKSIGQAFFTQLDPALRNISGIVHPLSIYLNDAATVLGHLAGLALTGFEKLVESPGWRTLTGGALDIIHSLGMAVIFLAQGFTRLAEVAVPFTSWLMHGVEDLAKRFDAWATNADKAGSNFRRWLTDVKPALDDIGHVLDAIVHGFKEIAGGPMGSPGSLNALKTFEEIMQALSKSILPDFFKMIGALTSPAYTSALIHLFVALSNLLLTIVQTPGFQVGFQAMITMFVAFVGVLAKIMSLGPVADIIGAIVGGLLAFTAASAALKFTGILSLITHFQQLTKWAQNAWSMMGKLLDRISGGKFGWTGGGPGAQASDADKMVSAADTQGTAAVKMQTAAEMMDAAADKMKTAAGMEEAAGTKQETAGTEQDTAATEELTAGGEQGAARAGGFLSKAGISGLGLSLAAAFLAGVTQYHIGALGNKTLWQAGNAPSQDKSISSQFGAGFSTGPGSNAMNSWAVDFRDIGQWWTRDVQTPINMFLGQRMPQLLKDVTDPGWWNSLNSGFVHDVQMPVTNFFGTTIPNFFTQQIPQSWDALWVVSETQFGKSIITPLVNFFSNTIPDFFTQTIPQAWDALWSMATTQFDSDIKQPILDLFTNLIPSALNTLESDWDGLWNRAWSSFDKNLLQPAKNFFTADLPNYFVSVGNSFIQKIADPLGHVFNVTLPKTIEGAFKESVNWVISNVINKSIGFINDVTHIVDIPAIKKVQTLAGGGGVFGHSVAGVGSGDTQPAMLTPGEWVIRQPARMALEREYGSNFLPGFINQADRVLTGQAPAYATGGSVSFGHPASSGQPMFMFAGGGSVGSVGSIDGFLGQLPGKVPYVWGGVGPGGYDCSGLTGQVYAMLLGYPEFRRYFTTDTFGDNTEANQLGFRPGTGKYTVGVNPATHMVGNLAGLRFEAANPRAGIIVGPGATDVRSMEKQFYLAHEGAGFSDGGGGGFLGGLLGGIGNALSGAGKALLGLFGGSASSLIGLADKGAETLFNVGWDRIAEPLLSKVTGGPSSEVGGISQGIMGSLKKGVDHLLSTVATGSTGGVGSTASGPGEQSFMSAVLRDIGASASTQNLQAMYGWAKHEEPSFPPPNRWNPFNIRPAGSSTGFMQYPSATAGASATASLIAGGYPAVASDFRHGWVNGFPGTAAELLRWSGGGYSSLAAGGPVTDHGKPAGDPHIPWRSLFHPPEQAQLADEMLRMWTGGDVISAVKQAGPSDKLRESMLLGSWLSSRWNPSLVKRTGHAERTEYERHVSRGRKSLEQLAHERHTTVDKLEETQRLAHRSGKMDDASYDRFFRYLRRDGARKHMPRGLVYYLRDDKRAATGPERAGAWQLPVDEHGERTRRHLEDPYWTAKYLRADFDTALGKSGWGQFPRDPEKAAALALHPDEDWYASLGAGGVNTGWDDTLKALGIKSQSQTGGDTSGTGGTRGDVEAQLWNYWAAKLQAGVSAEQPLAAKLIGTGDPVSSITGHTRKNHLPVGSLEWSRWYAMDRVLNEQQKLALSSKGSAFSDLWDNFKAPQQMTEAEWTAFMTKAGQMAAWTGGTAVPREFWKYENLDAKWPKEPKPHHGHRPDFARETVGRNEHRSLHHVAMGRHTSVKRLEEIQNEAHKDGLLDQRHYEEFLSYIKKRGPDKDMPEGLVYYVHNLGAGTTEHPGASGGGGAGGGSGPGHGHHKYHPDPGHVEPTIWAMKTYESGDWKKLTDSLGSPTGPAPRILSKDPHPKGGGALMPLPSPAHGLMATATKAKDTWESLWGPGGSLLPHHVTGPATPGPGTPPSSARPRPTHYQFDFGGGPQTPQYADGGMVGDMFAPGFSFGGSVMPDMSDRPWASEASRSLSEAGSAAGGTRVGQQFGDINIHNPVAERASDTIAHRTQRLALLAGRGAF